MFFLTPEATVILIAHKPRLINQMERVFTMYNGRLIEKKKEPTSEIQKQN